jgi:hypothetical protein
MRRKIQFLKLDSQPKKYDQILRIRSIIFGFTLAFILLNILPPVLQIPITSTVSAEVNPEILGTGPGRFNSILADDIDDDGRHEIVFGNYEGYVSVLEYRSGDFYEEWRSPKIGHRVWGITVADFVGDSTNEIIAGNGDGDIYAYDAKTYKEVWHAEDLVRDVHGLLVHDLGRGGKPYLLAGTGYKTDNDLGTLYIFTGENTTPISKIGNFENRFRGVAVGDVDADGEPEIVIGSGVATGENPGEGYVRTYDIDSALDPATLQTEDPIKPEWKSKNLKGDCVAIELADFTGDGFPDIVVGNGYRYQAGWVRILTYDSESQDFREYWKSPNDPDIGPKPYGLAVGDVDDDDNLEIVVGNQAGYIYIYEHRDSRIEQEWKSKLLGSDILGLDLADVDADGQIEIIAAQGGYVGKGDYTSGYSEPHIYVIDGKSHKIENTIGETSWWNFTFFVILIFLVIIFLVLLNYYARSRKQLKTLQPASMVQTSKVESASGSRVTPAGSGASASVSVASLSFSGPPTSTQTMKATPSPMPKVNDPFPPKVNDPFPPKVNDPFPPKVNDPFPPHQTNNSQQNKPRTGGVN